MFVLETHVIPELRHPDKADRRANAHCALPLSNPRRPPYNTRLTPRQTTTPIPRKTRP